MPIEFESVTTKGGDGGSTSLWDGSRVRKTSHVIEVLGLADELNAHIGVLISKDTLNSRDLKTLNHIQEDLYVLMGVTASSPIVFEKSRVDALERVQRRIMKKCDIPQVFITFNSNETCAYINLIRTKVRQVERHYLMTDRATKTIKTYLNRLSDYMYVLSLVYMPERKKRLLPRRK